jgi:uncharacterized protein YbaR (Trm112 family)
MLDSSLGNMRRKLLQHSRLFAELSTELTKVKPNLFDVVCCPLCLREFRLEAIKDLSQEHFVSSKLGGTGSTLTCRLCNNTGGTEFERHLVSAMKALDGFAGEDMLAARWRNDKGLVSANVRGPRGPLGSKEGPTTISIVGQASNPAAIAAARSQFFGGATVTLNFNFDFIPERYWKAALRAAYLTAFEVYGYKYVFSAGAIQVRDVLDGRAPVPRKLVMEAFPHQEPSNERMIMPTRLDQLGEFFVVLLRLVRRRTRYIAVLMPGEPGCDWNVLTRVNMTPRSMRIQTTPQGWTSPLNISLEPDPIAPLFRSVSER